MPSQQMPSLKSDISLSSLKQLKLPSGSPSFLTGNISFKRRRTIAVGVDVQPGYIAAARAHANGGLVVDEASAVSLPADTVREGEVLNVEGLAGALRELFANTELDKHVRLGVANQRTVMRTVLVPPQLDAKELAAAVRFQAEDQMPMPLASAVIDYRPLAVVDTPEGARQRVLVVAAQRDMIDKLLAAVKGAGLHPESVDLSAFALIRSLYRPIMAAAANGGGEDTEPGRVLHLNVGGLTNMAIAEGASCNFTRVLGRGLEAIAGEVAERRAIPIDQARELLRQVNLSSLAGEQHATLGMLGGPEAHSAEAVAAQMEQARAETAEAPSFDQPAAEAAPPAEPALPGDAGEHERPTLTVVGGGEGGEAPETPAGPPPVEPLEPDTSFAGGAQSEGATMGVAPVEPATPDVGGAQIAQAGEPFATGAPSEGAAPEEAFASEAAAEPAIPAQPPADPAPAPAPAAREDVSDVRVVLEAGVRGIASEVRNSLDFYQAQENGQPVSTVLLSGPALDIPGFGEMLEQNLGVPVQAETIATTPASVLHGISAQYLAIAAGLAVEEV